MYVIAARNVNDAFTQGMYLLKTEGVPQSSRAGDVLVMPSPVTTEYKRPTERVLFHPGRDANHVFHLLESLWMLAGRNDATWLDQFVGDFSARFAEEGGRQHGAYGYRWRKHFDMEGGGHPSLPDQLNTIVTLLKTNPDDRRIVLQMWDPASDLNALKKDVPCNTQAYFRVRQILGEPEPYGGMPLIRSVLDMTVCCRSNDAIWGAYGANAVHFSILQEYLAARIGVSVGTYYQVSNNFHVYRNVLDKVNMSLVGSLNYAYSENQNEPWPVQLVTDPASFDGELELFMLDHTPASCKNPFFNLVAVPMRAAYGLWRARQKEAALVALQSMPHLCDWRVATEAWMRRRMAKGVPEKSEEGVAR